MRHKNKTVQKCVCLFIKPGLKYVNCSLISKEVYVLLSEKLAQAWKYYILLGKCIIILTVIFYSTKNC